MNAIEQVAYLARQNGQSYGEYVATHDTSSVVSKKKKRKKHVCQKCGKEIVNTRNGYRKVCDDCVSQASRDRAKTFHSNKKPCKCRVCGTPLMRVKNLDNAICQVCLNNQRSLAALDRTKGR